MRLTALLTLVVLAMLATATPAAAHAELIGSNPAHGAAVGTVPTQVQLTFSEPVSPVSIRVAGSPGTEWTIGQIAVEGAVVTVPVQPVGPAGPYAISWTVTSEDGDDVSGTINFTMTVAAAAPATPTATTTDTTTETTQTVPSSAPAPAPAAAPAQDEGGVAPWVWVLIGLAVLLIAGLLLTRRARATPAGPGEDRPGGTEP